MADTSVTLTQSQSSSSSGVTYRGYVINLCNNSKVDDGDWDYDSVTGITASTNSNKITVWNTNTTGSSVSNTFTWTSSKVSGCSKTLKVTAEGAVVTLKSGNTKIIVTAIYDKSGTVYNTSWPPHSTDTKLYNMIPFRFIPVSDTLPNDIRSQYKMEVIYPSNSRFAGWKGYYFKKINFNDTDGIQMMVDGKPYTPMWADTAKDPNAETVGGYVNAFKGDKVQTNYIDIGMKISAEEFKEWFNFIDKSLENASISEIGLITGLDAFKDSDGVLTPVADLPESTANLSNIKMNSEIYDAELFAHLTFDPYSVARDNSTIDFQYRIYS